MSLQKIIILFIAVLFNTAINVFNSQGQVILPAIPDSLTNPNDRADFLIAHYWDNFNFADTSDKNQSVEQDFVDYIYILPYASDITKIQNSLKKLLLNTAEEKTGNTSHSFLSLAEKYLYEIASPVQNDEYYIAVLEQALANENLQESYKVKYEIQLQDIKKNRIGEKASDFIFYNQNKEQQMSGIKSPYLLLLFYNPDCHSCIETINEIDNSDLLNQLSENKTIKILKLSVEKDNDLQYVSYPEILDLYFIRSFPSLYLLDKNKVVMLKNTDYKQLITFFD